MSAQLREAGIVWQPDLAGTTATTVFPSGASAGVAIPTNTGRGGARVHIAVDYRVASGTMSVMVPVYGYTKANPALTGSGSFSTSAWVYLGSLNGGSSIGADTSKWSESSTHIAFAEVFSVSVDNYDRIATRAYAPGGTTPVISTYVGFPME